MIFEVDVTVRNSQKEILAHCECSKCSLDATRKNTRPDHHHHCGAAFHVTANIIFKYTFDYTPENYLKSSLASY